ncbi:MAG: flippase-like protein [Nocardioidaceae bacterium]|nr:flippase-like protein [Nocardioidaceae bacterium]
MSARNGAWLRLGLGVLVIAVLVWRLGAGAWVHGVRSLSPGVLLAGTLLNVPVTVACAWRWLRVSRALEEPHGSLAAATAAYYRAQLLNTTLPGGVLGDVGRAVGHGVRAVVWERIAGQAVQLGLTVLALLVLPAEVPRVVPVAVVVAWLATTLLLARGVPLPAWPGVVVASALAVVGHVATFVLAAHAVGVSAPLSSLVPLALLVLLAMAVPANVAGWGPREGAAAWLFAAAGLGADAGLATAVAYGVLVLVASLPGLAVLLVGYRRHRPTSQPSRDLVAVGRG